MTPISIGRRPSDLAYDRVAGVVPEVEWAGFADDIDAIEALKAEKNAVVLAHNYQTPEIFHGVADIVGDSLALARKAQEVEADVILLAGVHFMAETAKLLNPEATVIVPDLQAGCSLAESITAQDVRDLRAAHPGLPVVTYVNTSAAVKAESDYCCTSGNAVAVLRHVTKEWGVERAIMIPDEYLAKNISAISGIDVVTHPGRCEVHERFTPRDIEHIRDGHPGVVVITHPECSPEVVAAADFSGSTAQMQDYVESRQPAKLALITECSMSDNLAAMNPGVDMIRPCNLCPHMKRNTLAKIRRSLETLTHEVTVEPEVAERARLAVDRMLAL
ncbi:MAG: quinolinate synthase NadA [Mobilicoccus sp.]|nr:quinolinate synthase NadA [Mobilicoccus sp.]